MEGHTKITDFLFIYVLITLNLMCEIHGYNLETRVPIVKQGEAGSFFGFSVAGHITVARPVPSAADKFNQSLILVGAPKYNTSRHGQSGLDKPAGGMFRCPLSTRGDDCTYENYDTTGKTDNEDASDQWMGVRVSSQGPGGSVTVCAHRYKTKTDSEIQGLGKCLMINSDLTLKSFNPEWKPCAGKPTGKGRYGYCQAGTGLYAVSHEKDDLNWCVAGTPGSGDWRGGFFGTTYHDEKKVTIKKSVNSPLVSIDNDDDSIENLDLLGVNLNSYVGFSVTAGTFSDNGIQIVAGAPRAENVGAVVIFEPRVGLGSEQELQKQIVMPGNSMTESFGYSVCVADLNGDGYDDLIVGAPLYYDRNTDAGGRVYIYLNKNQNADFTQVEPIILTGERDSMFGIAVINLGDINLDGKQDIAIGSPYENKSQGAVHIFHGSDDGIVQPATQIIEPHMLPDGLPVERSFNHTFGYSLSGGVDLDGNDYPELIVGAFQTDTIVTLRARPVVTLKAWLNTSKPVLNPDLYDCEEKLNGKSTICLDITVVMRSDSRSEAFAGESVDVLFSIEAETERRNDLRKPSRVIFKDTETYEVTNQAMRIKPKWDEEDTISKEYRVIIQEGVTDIFRPIPFRLSYELVQEPPEIPEPGADITNIQKYPILEGAKDGKVVSDQPSLTVDFEKECAKDDGVCITDLSMVVTTNLKGDPPVLQIGKEKVLEVKIALQNLDEEAYDAKIVIEFPETLAFNVFAEMAIQKCSTSDTEPTLITCDLGNPYPPNMKTENFVFKFDTTDVPPNFDNFTITINATSANDDSNPDDNSVVIFTEVVGVTDLQIFTKDVQQFEYSGIVTGESAFEYEDDIGVLVKHKWIVYNKGNTVPETKFTVYFPYEASTGKWLLYMTDPPKILGDRGTCDIDPMYINPVGYKKRYPEEPDYDYETESIQPDTMNDKQGGVGKETGKETEDKDINQRRRRDAEELKSDDDDDGGNALVLDCMDESSPITPRCFQFTCTLDALSDNDEIEIVVRSRLWNSTFIEDYADVDLVQIYSHAIVEMVGAPYLTQDITANDKLVLVTSVRKAFSDQPPRAPLQWWIIVLAVIAGLILLIIFILLLWKCGFFKRKHQAYKYAQVEQMTAVKGKTDKRMYYDDHYM